MGLWNVTMISHNNDLSFLFFNGKWRERKTNYSESRRCSIPAHPTTLAHGSESMLMCTTNSSSPNARDPWPSVFTADRCKLRYHRREVRIRGSQGNPGSNLRQPETVSGIEAFGVNLFELSPRLRCIQIANPGVHGVLWYKCTLSSQRLTTSFLVLLIAAEIFIYHNSKQAHTNTAYIYICTHAHGFNGK